MRCMLNDKKIASLKPETRRLEYWDTLLPGFGIRITPNGRKSFFVMCRSRGKQKRITLGHYPMTPLSDARCKAQEKLRLAYEGKLLEGSEQKILSVADAFDLFVELYAKRKNKDWKSTQSRMRHTFIKEYRCFNIRDITRQDIITLIDKIVARKAPIQANRVLAATSKFLKWCAERGYIEHSPAVNIPKPARENPRDRVLTDDELKKIWDCSNDLGYPFGAILQILILTGQRKGEVSGMRWSELDIKEKIWTIPKERAKNGRTHTVPLSASVVHILETLPRFLHSDLVFTTTGKTPVSGFGKIKARLDRLSGVNDWIIHDLRRTATSGMARLKTPPHVIEKILNHVSGTFSSVAGVYNRYGYDDEKRQALERWDQHIREAIQNDRYDEKTYFSKGGF
jgi:integrase